MTTTSTTTAVPAPISRDVAGRLLGQTMGLVAVTFGLFALGAYVGRDTSAEWAIGWFLVAFAALLAMNIAAQRSEQLAVGLLFGFGLLMGLAVAPTVAYYIGEDPKAVWLAGGATALFMAASRLQCSRTATPPKRPIMKLPFIVPSLRFERPPTLGRLTLR
jgi:FtsH-binding integral membrane protein